MYALFLSQVLTLLALDYMQLLWLKFTPNLILVISIDIAFLVMLSRYLDTV